MMKQTGELIQQLRIEAGYTQKSLAAALHITDKAISKWERGICLPDVSLLPKLSLLLDADVELLVSNSIAEENWLGLIEIENCDFSQIVYDKPLVYYLLSHFLLLGIRQIHALTNNDNETYLKSNTFEELGVNFVFEKPRKSSNLMIIDHPWFLFGSDLTQQFQGAMLSQRKIKLVPQNQQAVFVFCPEADMDAYFSDKKEFVKKASVRTLGRGMVCLDMDDYDKIVDVSYFVRTYQKNAGLLIGSIEEIAYNMDFIDEKQLTDLADNVSYGNVLKQVAKKGKFHK